MNTIQLSPAACQRVLSLIKKENNSNLKFRISISGGGCSGFQYGFSFEERIESDDCLFDIDGVQVVVDPMSMMYLTGATVDYIANLYGAHFSVKNPQAKTTCGCGSSFSIGILAD